MMMKITAILVLCALSGCATSGFRPLPTAKYFRDNIIFSDAHSVAEVEAAGFAAVKVSGRTDMPNVPFGFMNDYWGQMKKKVQPGDRLVFFTSPKEDWDDLCGMEGYALIRGDLLIDVLLIRVN